MQLRIQYFLVYLLFCLNTIAVGVQMANAQPTGTSTTSTLTVEKHPAQIQLQNNIADILVILNDTQASEQEKIEHLELYADEYLDYHRISALSIGLKWKTFTAQQKKEFIQTFKDLVIDLYVRKGIYHAQDSSFKILPRFFEERNGRKVGVFIEILNHKGKKYTVEYQLYKSDDIYKIYNIKVEDLSFVSIFRSNFNDMIDKKGVDGFIADLKAKRNKKLTSNYGK